MLITNKSNATSINNLYRLRSEIINSPSAANNSLKRNSLFLIKWPWIEWSLWRTQNAIFTLTRAYECELWTNKLLEASGINLNSGLENVYDKQKLQTRKAVVSSPYGGEMADSQMRIKMTNSNNSQRITVPTIESLSNRTRSWGGGGHSQNFHSSKINDSWSMILFK